MSLSHLIAYTGVDLTESVFEIRKASELGKRAKVI